MSARRITRKQMKKDEFVSTVSKIAMYIEEHWQLFAYGIGAIAVNILIIFSTVYYLNYKEENLVRVLNQGIEYFHAPISVESDQNIASIEPTFKTEKERYQEALKIFQQILEEAPRSRVAALALYYSGLSHFHLEMYPEASKDLEEFIAQAEETLLRDVARSSLAQAYSRGDNYEASARVWSELAEDQTSLYPQADALLHLAEAKAAQGKTEEAMDIYKRIVNEFPGTMAAMEARNFIS